MAELATERSNMVIKEDTPYSPQNLRRKRNRTQDEEYGNLEQEVRETKKQLAQANQEFEDILKEHLLS